MSPLDKPLARMVVELDEAFAAPPKSGEERLPYINALVAVSRFAKSAGIDPAWRRLHEFAEKLNDLDYGRVDSLLTPTSKGRGTAPDSGVKWNKRVLVVVAFAALLKADKGQQEAARYIKKKFPKLKSLMTRGEDLSTAVLVWRRKLLDARPGNPLHRFGTNLAELENELNEQRLTPERWQQGADRMLAKLS
jgi:hypothetical protein